MNPNVIQFACGHCQSWLTVPAQMAGVAGPCPKCGNHIVSPQASQQPVFEPAPAPPQPQPSPPPAWPGAGLAQPPRDTVQAGSLPRPVQPAAAPNDIFPPAPPAQPMVPPPGAPMHWGQPPGAGQTIQDNGLPGGYPLHSQGLRPNAGLLPNPRGQMLPSPVGPANPVAGLMGQMPGGGIVSDHPGQAGMLTRPASVGGSRLSLLARQLTTPPEGAPGLPVAPAPLSNSDLPGQMPMAYAAPDGSRNQQTGDMMLKQSMRRGLGVSRSRSQGKVKFALAALVILGLLGALVWQYRAPLKDIVTQVFPPKPALPETVAATSTGPVPGVDKLTLDHVPEAGTHPVSTPEKSSTSPATTSKSTVVKATPVLEPEEPQSVKPLSAAPPNEVVSKPKPIGPNATKEGLQLMATINAPRATLAEGPDATAEVKPSALPIPPPPANPLADGQTKLVEVGRSTTDPKMAQSAPTAPAPALVAGQPSIKNVPPACKPALDGLLSFLNARNWQERLKYIQLPEQMEPKLKLYYASNPDGLIDVDEIQYLRHDESPQVGKGLHAVFVLFSRNWEYGFPVMVEVTPEGARVDWLTFIEFKDDMLNKFLSNYMEERVQFHVGIHRTHYFDDNIPGLDQKEQFSVTSPMENVRGFVFVPKGTPFARSLASTISWDKEASWVVVELQWRKEGSAKWVEMTALPQLNWYSAGAAPAASPAAERQAPPPAAPPGTISR